MPVALKVVNLLTVLGAVAVIVVALIAVYQRRQWLLPQENVGRHRKVSDNAVGVITNLLSLVAAAAALFEALTSPPSAATIVQNLTTLAVAWILILPSARVIGLVLSARRLAITLIVGSAVLAVMCGWVLLVRTKVSIEQVTGPQPENKKNCIFTQSGGTCTQSTWWTLNESRRTIRIVYAVSSHPGNVDGRELFFYARTGEGEKTCDAEVRWRAWIDGHLVKDEPLNDQVQSLRVTYDSLEIAAEFQVSGGGDCSAKVFVFDHYGMAQHW